MEPTVDCWLIGFVFPRTLHTVLHSDLSQCAFPRMVSKGSLFSISSPAFVSSDVPWDSSSSRCDGISHCVPGCLLLMGSHGEDLFFLPVPHVFMSSGKMREHWPLGLGPSDKTSLQETLRLIPGTYRGGFRNALLAEVRVLE